MGWEYSNYKATCAGCGREGICIKGSDDWCRSSTTWEGFKNHSADPNDIGRIRADTRDQRPECECGSRHIIVGELIKE